MNKVFNYFDAMATKLVSVMKALEFGTSEEKVNRMEELDTDHNSFINLKEFINLCGDDITEAGGNLKS
ncbi:hypothetical protein ACSBR1_037826 [Camellia fascicularis]